jgi:5-formyltetrahydrofolate cyclo-ligase
MQDPIAIRAALRRQLKLQRRQLPVREREARSRRIAAALRRAHLIKPRQRVALYSPTAGEVMLTDVVDWLRNLHCELFLPRIVSWRARRMRFAKWEVDSPLRTHRFGMHEPVARAAVSTLQLDVVLLPALAIDANGNRLGMGAGFYDRSFAHRRRSRWRRPRLIAVVYDFQRIDSLPAGRFDVPVDAVVSESGLHWFRSDHQGSRG